MAAARFDDVVGDDIQDWALSRFDREIDAALDDGGDLDTKQFKTWFLNDRFVAGGSTPAERYAARSSLPDDVQAAAERIASARLGCYRVLVVQPARSLVLEEVVERRCVRVESPYASRTAVPGDILLVRLMGGDPPTLWGPVRVFEPDEEPELRDELARIAGLPYEEWTLALLRYRPPSRLALLREEPPRRAAA